MNPSLQPVLEINSLNKWYGSHHAVKDLSLTVNKGQIYGILGPNGSGKTTALGMILGILKPSSGQFKWFQESTYNDHVKTRIGSLLEHPNFYPWMSAERNLEMVLAIRGTNQKGKPKELVSNVLEMVKLSKHKKEAFQTYSLGMKQRLAIAASIIANPEVLVLDEPTNGIDAEGIVEIRHLIQNLAKNGTTVLLASHILDEVEKTCSHVIVLKDGKMLDQGKISEVLAQDSWIELSCSDLYNLKPILNSCPFVLKIEERPSLIRVQIPKDQDPATLNKFIYEHGVNLSHLYRKQGSLESHFLKLLEQKS